MAAPNNSSQQLLEPNKTSNNKFEGTLFCLFLANDQRGTAMLEVESSNLIEDDF